MNKYDLHLITEIIAALLVDAADESDGDSIQVDKVQGGVTFNCLQVIINNQKFELTIKEIEE